MVKIKKSGFNMLQGTNFVFIKKTRNKFFFWDPKKKVNKNM